MNYFVVARTAGSKDPVFCNRSDIISLLPNNRYKPFEPKATNEPRKGRFGLLTLNASGEKVVKEVKILFMTETVEMRDSMLSDRKISKTSVKGLNENDMPFSQFVLQEEIEQAKENKKTKKELASCMPGEENLRNKIEKKRKVSEKDQNLKTKRVKSGIKDLVNTDESEKPSKSEQVVDKAAKPLKPLPEQVVDKAAKPLKPLSEQVEDKQEPSQKEKAPSLSTDFESQYKWLNHLFSIRDFSVALGQELVLGYRFKNFNEINSIEMQLESLRQDVAGFQTEVRQQFAALTDLITSLQMRPPQTQVEKHAEYLQAPEKEIIFTKGKALSSKKVLSIIKAEENSRFKINIFLTSLYMDTELAEMWLEQDKNGSRKIFPRDVITTITEHLNSTSNRRTKNKGEPQKGENYTENFVRGKISKILFEVRKKIKDEVDHKSGKKENNKEDLNEKISKVSTEKTDSSGEEIAEDFNENENDSMNVSKASEISGSDDDSEADAE